MVRVRLSMLQRNNEHSNIHNMTDKKISAHFRKMGKASWEARKAKILGVKLDKKTIHSSSKK